MGKAGSARLVKQPHPICPFPETANPAACWTREQLVRISWDLLPAAKGVLVPLSLLLAARVDLCPISRGTKFYVLKK